MFIERIVDAHRSAFWEYPRCVEDDRRTLASLKHGLRRNPPHPRRYVVRRNESRDLTSGEFDLRKRKLRALHRAPICGFSSSSGGVVEMVNDPASCTALAYRVADD